MSAAWFGSGEIETNLAGTTPTEPGRSSVPAFQWQLGQAITPSLDACASQKNAFPRMTAFPKSLISPPLGCGAGTVASGTRGTLVRTRTGSSTRAEGPSWRSGALGPSVHPARKKPTPIRETVANTRDERDERKE